MSGDAEAMAVLDRLCFTDPWSKASFDNELDNDSLAFYLIAESDGNIIGYAGLWFIEDEGHITNIAVHPQHRRKGVGGILLTKLMTYAEKAGLEHFTLEVRAGNKDAIELYEKYGFHVEGCRRGYYGNNGEDALIMWKSV